MLVLDEAWTGLDAAARDELDRAVADRAAAGSTVVFVDHDVRRLAGAVDTVLRVEGTGLAEASPARTGREPGPRVRIEVTGPPGARSPPDCPETPSGPPPGTEPCG